MEIRDGQWALQHHLEGSVRGAAEQHHRAAGLTGVELAFAVTADQIRAALTAHNRNEPRQTPTEYADANTRADILTPDDDVRALLRVTSHFATSPDEQEAAPSWT